MLSIDSVINLLKIISKDSRLNNIQMGLFGSFARNEAKELGIEEFTLKPAIDREVIWIGR